MFQNELSRRLNQGVIDEMRGMDPQARGEGPSATSKLEYDLNNIEQSADQPSPQPGQSTNGRSNIDKRIEFVQRRMREEGLADGVADGEYDQSEQAQYTQTKILNCKELLEEHAEALK